MRQAMPRPLKVAIACALAGAALAGLIFWERQAERRVGIPEIQAEIERHIAEISMRSGGYYKLSAGGKDYDFKLVRVHTEYLSRVSRGNYFACVDLVDQAGDVYDTDFFLKGRPGRMKVTETTLHKLNGIPFYTWKQGDDGLWSRVPVEGAPPKLLGVITGKDEFEFRYRTRIPELAGPARLWLPLPATDEFQSVEMVGMESPREPRVLTENAYGNRALFFELDPSDGGKSVEVRYKVRRREKAAYPAGNDGIEKFLRAEQMVPNSEEFRSIAAKAVEGKRGDLVRARAIYDQVIDHMRYMKYGKGWGKGDAVRACSLRSGNCSDFHAYFVGLARAAGIPARFAVGAAVPSERDDGGIDGYHCWAEFYAERKWWPVDVSEADKYSSLATYYFGHHPANRIEFSRGRDLTFDPGPRSGPINFLAYPILETGGRSDRMNAEFSFQRVL